MRKLKSAPLLGIASMIALTVGANLMLKLGAMVPPAQRVLFDELAWQSVVGGSRVAHIPTATTAAGCGMK